MVDIDINLVEIELELGKVAKIFRLGNLESSKRSS